MKDERLAIRDQGFAIHFNSIGNTEKLRGSPTGVTLSPATRLIVAR